MPDNGAVYLGVTNFMKRKKCDQDPDCAKIEKQLKDALGPDKSKYEVVKLTQSGSDAVMVACLDATKCDISRLLQSFAF